MFNIDKRSIYIILAIILVVYLVNAGSEGILSLLLTLPGVVIAITFHEYAHAITAYKLGDNTPLYQGRLNLNPLSHIDPLGIILLIVAHFGWGKPVEINPNNFKGKYSVSASEAIVSVAGPIANFLVAIIFAFIYAIVVKVLGINFLYNSMGMALLTVLQYTIIVNIGLGVFNLIPLPPLDGSKVLNHFLPYNVRSWFEEREMYFYFAFLILFITGLAGEFISPAIEFIYNLIMNFVLGLF